MIGPERGARLQRIIDDHFAANPELAGEVLTVSTPTWTWSGASGGVPGSTERLTARHRFRIASMTKPFIAAAVLRLMEVGAVDVTRPIDRHVSPDTGRLLRDGGHDPAAITVRQLLAHTSGIGSFTDHPEFTAILEREPGHRWTRAEQIRLAVDRAGPGSAPGTACAYSDTNYVVLGEVIERATGRPLGPAVRDLLDYDAIGLADTSWERMEPRPRPAPFSGALLDGMDMTGHDHSFDLFGGGGLISTSSDLALFLRALVEGRVLARSSSLAVLLAVPCAVRPEGVPLLAHGVAFYPVGRFIGIGHQGFWGQLAVYCPENGVAITWSTNHSGTADRVDVVQDVAAALDMS